MSFGTQGTAGTGIAPPPATDEVFTGLEGLITPAQLAAARRARADKQFAQESSQLRGRNLGSRTAGRLLGKGIGKLFNREDNQMAQAQASKQAADTAKAAVAEQEFDGPTAMLDRQMAVVRETVNQLEEQGLGPQADVLRSNLIQLHKQKINFQKELAGLDSTIVSTEGKKLDNEIKSAEQKAGDFGQSELSQLQNRLSTLDPMDPVQAQKRDEINARINKLVSVVGRTEFDKPDKVNFRNALEGLGESRSTLDRFLGIQESYNPEFLNLMGKVENWGLKTADIVGLPLDNEQKQKIAEFTEFRSRVGQNLSLYIKQITGAQMSEAEAQRLIKDLTNEKDSPEQFQAKLGDALITLEGEFRKRAALAEAAARGDKQGQIDVVKIPLKTFKDEVIAERDDADERADLMGKLGITPQ